MKDKIVLSMLLAIILGGFQISNAMDDPDYQNIPPVSGSSSEEVLYQNVPEIEPQSSGSPSSSEKEDVFGRVFFQKKSSEKNFYQNVPNLPSEEVIYQNVDTVPPEQSLQESFYQNIPKSSGRGQPEYKTPPRPMSTTYKQPPLAKKRTTAAAKLITQKQKFKIKNKMKHDIIVKAQNAQGVEIIKWQVMNKRDKFTLKRKIEGAFPQNITFTVYRYLTEKGMENKTIQIGSKTVNIQSPTTTITIKSKDSILQFKIK